MKRKLLIASASLLTVVLMVLCFVLGEKCLKATVAEPTLLPPHSLVINIDDNTAEYVIGETRIKLPLTECELDNDETVRIKAFNAFKDGVVYDWAPRFTVKVKGSNIPKNVEYRVCRFDENGDKASGDIQYPTGKIDLTNGEGEMNLGLMDVLTSNLSGKRYLGIWISYEISGNRYEVVMAQDPNIMVTIK